MNHDLIIFDFFSSNNIFKYYMQYILMVNKLIYRNLNYILLLLQLRYSKNKFLVQTLQQYEFYVNKNYFD
jgi:hypothetical protein